MQVCREAVVRIAHEKAHELDTAGIGPEEEIDLTAKLRPVTMEDFWEARKKVTFEPSGSTSGVFFTHVRSMQLGCLWEH